MSTAFYTIPFMIKVIPVLVTNPPPPQCKKVKMNGLDVGEVPIELSVESTKFYQIR